MADYNVTKDNPTVAENRKAGALEWQLRNARFGDPVTLGSVDIFVIPVKTGIQIPDIRYRQF